MDFADFQKMVDPRKITEAYFGTLGSFSGIPFGAFGSFGQYSAKSFFDPGNYYNAGGYYDAKTFVRSALK